MTGFALAYVTFMATHFVPTRPAIRERLIGAMGRRVWFLLYGLISLAVTVWIIWAAGQAPTIELWPQFPWTRWVPNLLMPLAVTLALCGLPARTVTLGGPRTSKLDPEHPGFAALTRHPLLWALALWSGAHLVPNGSLTHVLLFGGFLVMALAAMPLFDARARRALGTEEASIYFASTSVLSLLPLFSLSLWRAIALRLLLALATWAALLGLHSSLIGVSPLPF